MGRANAVSGVTAELVSVERCSEPEPRPSRRCFRHHAACQRGAMFKSQCHGSLSDSTRRVVLNTAPPGRAGRWRGAQTRTQRSGAERGSTLASSVAAPGSGDERSPITGRRRLIVNYPFARLRRSRASYAQHGRELVGCKSPVRKRDCFGGQYTKCKPTKQKY
jgi:hypothetical protein